MRSSGSIPRKAAPGIGRDRFVRVQESGADGIKVDVITNGAEVSGGFAVDEQCFIATAEDVAEEFVAMVEANGVGAQEPAHAFDQVRLGRLGHEMNMRQ